MAQAREMARRALCGSNLGQLGMVHTMYADDHADGLATGDSWIADTPIMCRINNPNAAGDFLSGTIIPESSFLYVCISSTKKADI